MRFGAHGCPLGDPEWLLEREGGSHFVETSMRTPQRQARIPCSSITPRRRGVIELCTRPPVSPSSALEARLQRERESLSLLPTGLCHLVCTPTEAKVSEQDLDRGHAYSTLTHARTHTHTHTHTHTYSHTHTLTHLHSQRKRGNVGDLVHETLDLLEMLGGRGTPFYPTPYTLNPK